MKDFVNLFEVQIIGLVFFLWLVFPPVLWVFFGLHNVFGILLSILIFVFLDVVVPFFVYQHYKIKKLEEKFEMKKAEDKFFRKYFQRKYSRKK